MHTGIEPLTSMYYLIFSLYNGIFIPLFYLAVHVAALFNRKIKRGLDGRGDLYASLQTQLASVPDRAARIWIHVSSMGEFEQIKPVIRSLKEKNASCCIVLSFFSPSGFDNAKSYSQADVITYLPADTYRGAKKFITLIKPDVALVVRHDIWPNFQWRLHRLGIPSILLNASIPPNRLLLMRLLRPFLRPVYKTFSEILVTSDENIRYFRIIYPYPDRIRAIGDTRYDQVCHRALETDRIKFLLNSGKFERRHCMVAGSTWPADERVILSAVVRAMSHYSDLLFIIAPHETSEEHVAAIDTYFNDKNIPAVRLSQFEGNNKPLRVLLIDRIGLLANLYALGALAYVGGGFGAGVHNVLEPAAHGTAVLFGPRHANSVEARNLIRIGAGHCIHHMDDVYIELKHMQETPEAIERQGKVAQGFVAANVGATERTVAAISEYLPGRESYA
ncbi:hypothetical protein JXO59_13560 [candidate division KSB1 bacterium]|nr:hypothetical protein [candidate division KSB1 bacterium]